MNLQNINFDVPPIEIPMADQISEISRQEMYQEIRRLCEPNNVTNWFWILLDYSIFAAIVWGSMSAYHLIVEAGYSRWWMVPIYLLAICIIGVWVQNRLSVLVHESSHYMLFKNRVLNDLAANFFLLFPVYGAIANYRRGHWEHHRYVNDPQRDPDLLRLSKHLPRDFPVSRARFFWEHIVWQLNVISGIRYIKGRALYVAIPMKDNEKAKPVKTSDALGRPLTFTLRMAYIAALFTVLTVYGWWPHYILFWIVPFLTFYPMVLFVREIAHHGNTADDDGDFTNSRVYRSNLLEHEIFFPFGEWNHVMHHLFPSIPHHKTRQAHDVLLRYAPYRDTVVTCNGFFSKYDASDEPTVLDVLAEPYERYARGAELPSDDGFIRDASAEEIGVEA